MGQGVDAVSVEAVLQTAMLVEDVAERLTAIGCVAAEEEAREMVDSARDREELDAFVSRRSQGEPLAWITGWVNFCGRRLYVDSGVYVPRFQSEELARRATAFLPQRGGRAVDLCTGSGAIAAVLTAAAPVASVIGVDLDPRAAACARRNEVPVIVADMGESLRPGIFDVVTAIAPYVPRDELRFLPADVQRYEPALALDGGEDGLELLRRAVTDAGRLLGPGGSLFVELGGDQDQALTPTLTATGFEITETWCDEDGDLRGLAAQLAEGAKVSERIG
ncbi:MAG: peptide chain release factor N(5)-glutamine methyltransferase [Acidimicrobiaceae bacterium]|nr:peptide chain release factor N(5)-glutamine methyltransferase [Acidimicrobiaceae bacterium]